MTSQLYRYRVFGSPHEGQWLLVGDVDARDGDHAIDEAIKVHQPEQVGLLSGAEFFATPVSKIRSGWRRLEQQAVLLTLDGPPEQAQPEPSEEAQAILEGEPAATPTGPQPVLGHRVPVEDDGA